MDRESRERNRLFNQGFDDAYEDTGCNIELYENSEPYRRGYDAGEDMIKEDGYEPLTDEEQRELYGEVDRI